MNSKSVKNQSFLLIFPITGPFSTFSLHRGLQPPPPSSTILSPSSPPQVAIKPPHVVVAPLLSLSSVKIFFFATVTAVAAATGETAATSSPRSSFPSQRKPEYQLSPQLLQLPQPQASLHLLKALLFLLLSAATRASNRSHHLNHTERRQLGH